MKRNAFTLIELIVVMAIIAVIAAIAIPNLIAAREQGRKRQQQNSPSRIVNTPRAVEVEKPIPIISEHLICETISTTSLFPDGREIQDLITRWQREHPKAKITSIVTVHKNEYAIGSIVITAYSASSTGR